jgi:transcriptional regulator with XRE-family HTH domain
VNRPMGENLRRLMANQGLTVAQVVRKSGLDRRTIQGILDGRSKPHPRTLHRLATSLGISGDEFFLDPAQLLYRRFDRQTNPVVQEVMEAEPGLFAGWTEADFDELHSRFGTGGPLTAEGVSAAAGDMNCKRSLHEKLSLLLESSHADLIRGILELLYKQVVVEEPETNG